MTALTPIERHILDLMKSGMQDALLRTGRCTVEDGYRALDRDPDTLGAEETGEFMRHLGPMAVRQLKAEFHLIRLAVDASPRPERHRGYRAVWGWPS